MVSHKHSIYGTHMLQHIYMLAFKISDKQKTIRYVALNPEV